MIPSDEPDAVVAAQLAEREADCARIREDLILRCHVNANGRDVVRCPGCRRKMYSRRNGLCPWCYTPLKAIPLPKPRVPERSLEFGAALRAVRKAAGLRENELGFNQVSVSQWERGKRIPTWAAAERIAARFGMEVADLIQGPEHAETAFWFWKLPLAEQAEICEKVRGMLV